ncbi:PH domain-containing protein [Patescibacteria group bacterium]|nr:PH domain-containing protein [Patescibacteria group bacterium]
MEPQDEKVIMVVRPHWIVLVGRVLLCLLFIAILFAFDKYVPAYFPRITQDPVVNYVNVFKTMYLMMFILGLFLVFSLYNLNYTIITNKRLIDIYQTGLFKRKVAELTFHTVEDVSSTVKGIFGTAFNYGNIVVQTAGERDQFFMNNVPNPQAIEKAIYDQVELNRHDQP